MKSKYTGKYLKAFLGDNKIKTESIEYEYYNSQVDVKDNEVSYIYSFKGNRLVFAKGFEKLNLKGDDGLDIHIIHSLFAKYYERFVNEYHDRILLYLYNNNERIDTFSSHVIINIKTIDIPLILKVKVFKTDDNGNLVSIIGTATVDDNLKTSDIIQYSIEGDLKPEFLEGINQDLDFIKCISNYNIKIIEELEKGKSQKEIADSLEIKEEVLTNILKNLLKKFEVETIEEMIEIAETKNIIPSQFDNYLKNIKQNEAEVHR